jgi:chemotaxis signal transduction protein
MREHSIPTSALFSSSHTQFLEQLSDQEFWNYAQTLSQTAPTPFVPSEDHLLCVHDQRRCFLPLAALREIIPPPHSFTLLPASPPWMSGVTAWHGQTLAVVDLDAYLMCRATRIRTDGSLLITQSDLVEETLGFLVSTIDTITTFETTQIVQSEPNLLWSHPACANVIKGIYSEGLVLDMPLVLTDIVQHIKMAASHA